MKLRIPKLDTYVWALIVVGLLILCGVVCYFYGLEVASPATLMMGGFGGIITAVEMTADKMNKRLTEEQKMALALREKEAERRKKADEEAALRVLEAQKDAEVDWRILPSAEVPKLEKRT